MIVDATPRPADTMSAVTAKMGGDMSDIGNPQAAPAEHDSTDSVDALVVGATVAGLTAARDLAMRGYRVLVIDEAAQAGGAAAAAELPSGASDFDAAPFTDPDGDVAKLCEELGLDLKSPATLRSQLLLGAKRLPVPLFSLLGIPASPLASEVASIVGWSGAVRAYLDRLMPVLKIGRYDNLEHLVGKRMGRRVAERMLRPTVRARLGVEAGGVDIDETIPALNNAITKAGSLSGAVAMLVEQAAHDSDGFERGIAGGINRLVTALVESITEYHGRTRLGTRIDIAERDDQGWLLTLTDGSLLRAQTLMYAETDMQRIDRVALEVPTSQLAAAPDVREVLPVASDVHAVTRASLLWPEKSEQAAEVVLLQYAADEKIPESEYLAKARDDAQRVLGVDLEPTAARLLAAPRYRIAPAASDRHAATVHVLEPEAQLSDTVKTAREAAAAVRREDFAVPGVSWAQQVNEELQEDE